MAKPLLVHLPDLVFMAVAVELALLHQTQLRTPLTAFVAVFGRHVLAVICRLIFDDGLSGEQR